MEKVKITLLNSNQAELDGPLKILNKLYNLYSIKHPNAWHIRNRTGWDGMVRFINDRGRFKIGLANNIYQDLLKMGCQVKVVDLRQPIDVKPVIPERIGKFEPRPKQKAALEAIINNRLGDVPFYIGVEDLSVNFGKTLIMAGLYLAFKRKIPAVILTNDSDWFRQAQSEMKELLPDDNVTFVQGSKVFNWSGITVAMVQSLARNIQNYQRELSKVGMVLIDECDQSGNKTYTSVLSHMYNAQIRVGLSGTVFMSERKKDRLDTLNVQSYIGNRINTVSLKETIEDGNSTNVIIKMVPTRLNQEKIDLGGYPEEYAQVVYHELSFKLVYKRLKRNIDKGKHPALIVTKYIPHCENLFLYLKKRLEKDYGNKYSISRVHHDSKDRARIISDFRAGKIDILISNSFIARGKNFPLLRYLLNAAGMDSNEKAIQLIGRLVRTHESKSKAYLDDIQYNGKYLSRHSNHRKNYYLKQKLVVIKLRLK